jgi:hypothetical protein
MDGAGVMITVITGAITGQVITSNASPGGLRGNDYLITAYRGEADDNAQMRT